MEGPDKQQLTFTRDDGDNLYYARLFVPFDDEYLLSMADGDADDEGEDDDFAPVDEESDEEEEINEETGGGKPICLFFLH